MSTNRIVPVDEEIHFSHDEIIVSKTDLKGRIIYANDVFCRVAEMNTSQVIGQPHSIIRHPDMPRAVFKLLWDSIEQGKEIFAYVKNMSATGKYYWVIAHVTPTFDANGNITGFHSNRRSPNSSSVASIKPVYEKLRSIESSHRNAKDGLNASSQHLADILSDKGMTYDEFVWSIGE